MGAGVALVNENARSGRKRVSIDPSDEANIKEAESSAISWYDLLQLRRELGKRV